MARGRTVALSPFRAAEVVISIIIFRGAGPDLAWGGTVQDIGLPRFLGPGGDALWFRNGIELFDKFKDKFI
jgi:hypothetical protein